MKILLTGRAGQVGWELERKLAPLGEVLATDRARLDLRDPDALRRAVREARPALIVNAAAYTAVDLAESEQAAAMQVNRDAPGVLAEEAKKAGALLLHFSTDYVFDGRKSDPYAEDDSPNPINVYGASKLAGEQAVAAAGCEYLVLRTGWIYAARGSNFLLTILRAAREKPELRVVSDQRGAPTAADALAAGAMQAISRGARGVLHMTAAGETTWHGFAAEIARLAGLPTRVVPITSEEYAGAARRPRNSVLANRKLEATCGFALEHWGAMLPRVISGALGRRPV